MANPKSMFSVVTPALYGLILSTPRLRQRLIPEGLRLSPYEVLECEATLYIVDAEGMHATLVRREKIRFLQEGVSGILDHAWGDGVVVTSYRTNAGTIEGTLRDGGRRHLMIGLKRPMHRGEILEFEVIRELFGGVMQSEEWLEMLIDHPVRQLIGNVVFPQERPCRWAAIQDGLKYRAIPIITSSGGSTIIHFRHPAAAPHTSYMLRWCW